MGSVARTWMIGVFFVGLLLLTAVLPQVAGDGMPAYRIVDVNDPDHPDLFTSTFESRQLARIDLVDGTHQRIRLFLSVYSLDPGKNLTIMVPMRTLPVDVTGEPMKESEFRKEYMLDRVETEVVHQDPEEAGAKLWSETSSALQMTFGSMLLTFPGEYSRQTFRLVDGDGKYGESTGTDGVKVRDDPVPVQHYEFDGFSIDVFGVDSAGRLDDYLAAKGLMIPESDALDRYRGQYVAVIEAEAKPPIDPELFSLCTTYAPNTTSGLIDTLREDPQLSPDERWDLQRATEREWQREVKGLSLSSQLHWDIEQAFDQLIDAVFGSTDFEGEVLTVDMPLDDGLMFFPLGTSAGWPNQVGDIDILFRVPEGKDLEIEGTKDAYFDGHHWYLFSMEQANPGFDLDSPVKEGDESRKAAAARAEWTYDNSTTLAYLIAFAIVMVLWIGFAFFLRRTYEIEGPLVRDPLLWGMLGLSFLVSIPGALLVYFMLWPLKGREIKENLAAITPMAMFPATVVMFILAVML